MSEIFENIKPGTFFLYEGWYMLKIQPFRGFNTIIIEPKNMYDNEMQHVVSDVNGSWTTIEDHESIKIVDYRFSL